MWKFNKLKSGESSDKINSNKPWNLAVTNAMPVQLKKRVRLWSFAWETASRQSILGNIYVGQVENIASNIQAAFVLIAPGVRGYFPLQEAEQVIYASGKAPGSPLRPGDQILVQVSRDAMKGKLPALTANLNFTGKYLVLTTGEKKFGLSGKLSGTERHTLSSWLEAEAARPNKEYGLIVRTNAAQAEKAEILQELSYLKSLYEKVAVNGKAAPVSAFSMKQNLFTLPLSVIFTAKILRTL